MEFPKVDDQTENIVEFYSEDIDFDLPDPDKVSDWIRETIRLEGLGLTHIQFVFCSDIFLHAINLEYLQHDTLTDIITFPYDEDPIEGDIYISIDRVRENAETFNVSFDQELHRVIIHGVLHLCGYGDKTPEEKNKMTQKENHYLKENSGHFLNDI